MPGLGDHQLKVAYAHNELWTATPEDLAEALNDVCLLAEESSATARDLLVGFMPVVIDVTLLSRWLSVRAAAAAANLMAIGRLLRATTSEGHLLDRERIGSSADVPQREDGRPLTLGERRALARQPSRAALDRLMRDPHPMVASIVLSNPRITEDDVVRMAAYRPARPEIVQEIGKTWCHHARPRRAIILNPGSPPAVSVPLLSLLNRPVLVEVARAADLPAVVRATAQDLWDLRPPLPPVDPPELKH